MVQCPNCQFTNPEDARFCMECGTKLEKSKHSIHAERRQVTFLFCDLVDSTALSEKYDAEEYRSIIYQYHQVVEQEVKEFGGTMGNYLGDGLLVYFGYPKALEDAPKVAINAALASIEALKNENKKWQQEGSPEINVRIGIHTGRAVVDEHLALGATVNIASRLESLAPTNKIVISPQTLELVEGWFEVNSLGKHKLKGIDKPMEVFEILGESGAKSRFEVTKKRGLSPLVGRENEVNLIEQYWDKVIEGTGKTILINGEAGIGKSRLVDSIQDTLTSINGIVSLQASSSAYHTSSSFYPIIGLLENEILGFDLSDDHDQKLNKLKSYLERRDLKDPNLLPILAEFLSIRSENYQPLMISPFAKRQITFDSLEKIIFDLSKDQPLLFVIEDLHWTDDSTLQWISQLVSKVNEQQILLIATTRSHFSPNWSENDVAEIIVERLSKSDIEKICLHQSAGKSIPDEVLEEISDKTDGVPLFVEELTKMILESNILLDSDDGLSTHKSLENLPIPSTLQDSLMARLDQLNNVKELVQFCSALGKEFSSKMLYEVAPQDRESLYSVIESLLDSEIFMERKIGEDQYYHFKHALIQDAAYDSILKSDRKKIHNQIAEVIEEKFEDIVNNQPEILAHHFTLGDMALKAIPLWLRAGQQSNQKNANQEAINHIKKGLELLPEVKSKEERKNLELDYYLTLGGCYVITHGFPHPKVKETFDKAREIAMHIEVSPKLALILLNLMSYYGNTEDYQSFGETDDYAKSLSTDPQHGYWFKLFRRLPGMRIIQGNLMLAEKYYNEVLELYNPEYPFPWELTPTGNALVTADSWRMVGLAALGNYKLGNELAEKHKEYLQHHHDSVTLYHIYTFPALYKLQMREWEAAKEILEEYFPIVRAFGDPVFNLTAEVYYNLAKAYLGDESAVEISRNLLETCMQIGFNAFSSALAPHLGIIYYEKGDFDSALEWTDRMIERMLNSGARFMLSESYRNKALTLKALGKENDEIEELLNKSLDIAKDQSAKTFELRAAYNYAKLKSENGDQKGAFKILNNELEKFDKETTSKDLHEARKFIDKIEL